MSVKSGRALRSQSREIIYNVHQFMQREAFYAKNTDFSKEYLQTVMQRTAQATGVSRKTVSVISQELKFSDLEASTSGGPACKNRKKNKSKQICRVVLDDFDYQLIRQKVYDFHLVENQVPSVTSLLNFLKKQIYYNGGQDSLCKILQELGFRFKNARSKKKILAETDEVRLLRIKYLRQMNQYRYEGRNIVYSDETFLSTRLEENELCDKSHNIVKKPTPKGDHLIVVLAGGSNGFVPGALLIYKSSQLIKDNRGDINAEIYEKWLKNQLIPNLPPNSVFVIDNAAYHNTLKENVPNANSSKYEMQQWLRNKNIPYNDKDLKPELYEKIRLIQKDYMQYSIDSIMEEYGHKVLRLPQYHPDFNPIEKIWAQIKGHMTENNTKVNFTDEIQLLYEKFSSIDTEDWLRVINHAIQCEKKFLALEEAIDKRLDELVVFSSSSSSEDSSDEDNFKIDIKMEKIDPLE